jgi:20S proteasome subunit alpha 2
MLIYEQNVPPTQLVKRVADVMQDYTQSGFVVYSLKLNFSGVRPFGVSLLICGYDYDEDRPFLYQCDPSVSLFLDRSRILHISI